MFATDFNHECCETLKINAGNTLNPNLVVEECDITTMNFDVLPQNIDMIIGGPPCQSFSASGRRAGGAAGKLDKRGNLFKSYCEVVDFLKPKAFLFENVRGILGTNKGKDFEDIVSAFAALGYHIDYRILDAEDYGAHDQDNEESWCLGAQYWARNPHVQGYNARFGILLDMVGGKNTVFLKESYSEKFAPDVNKKVWKAARKLGYGNLFINEDGGGVTDDHLFINRLARIKTIDIIASDPEGGFTPTWHTLTDNMDHIDKNTLKAVGQTVLEIIYNEK